MIEPLIVAALGPLVGGRVFDDVAPVDTPTPYCTYQQVGGRPVNFLEGQPASKKNARIQINVWSKRRAEATTLIRQIEDLMIQAPLLGVVEGGAISQYDSVSSFRGAMQDFSFWFEA